MKSKLKKINEQIAAFEKIVWDFPQAAVYQDILAKLQTDRANIVAQIGRAGRPN